MEAIIELQDVWKIYQMGEFDVPALQGIDLAIKKGESVAITGPSGCGKSTMLNMIGCLDMPTSGKILLESKDISKFSEEDLARIRGKKIGFVFQTFSLLPRLTALDNVALPLIYAGVKKRERTEKAKEILGKIGLADRIYHRPNEMSGGECQRVAIARALVNDPKVIFADEPTGNLDSKTGAEIMEIFDKLNDEGNTLVMVTHDPNVADHAKRTIKLKDGLIENG